MNTYPLPTEPGYYRREFPDTPRRCYALCTLRVFRDEGCGELFFKFLDLPFEGSPVPVSLFKGHSGRQWYGPFETREEADAFAPQGAGAGEER